MVFLSAGDRVLFRSPGPDLKPGYGPVQKVKERRLAKRPVPFLFFICMPGGRSLDYASG